MHIYIYTHRQNQNSPTKIKYDSLTQQTKETKNYINQNKANQSTNCKKKLKQVANWGIKNENETNKYVETKGDKDKKERIDAKLNRGR